MNARSSMLSIAVVVLVILVLGFYMKGRDSDTTQPLSKSAETGFGDEALNQSADELYDALAAENADALFVIHQEMLALKMQISDLRSQLNVAQLHTTTAGDEGNADVRLTEDELQAKARQESLDQIMVIEDNFQAEMTDPDWSQTAESRLQNAFTGQGLAEHSLRNMECKTSLCRLDVVHQEGADMNEFRSSLRDQVSDILPAGAIRPGDKGGTVLYLAKDSASLSDMSPR